MAHYCSQDDVQYRIGTKLLAQLTNDTANATTPDATVVDAILTEVDTVIDSKAGQVYTVPFTTVPDLVKYTAIRFAIYYCFQRRPDIIEMPKMWDDAYKKAMETLEAISNQEIYLPPSTVIVSPELNIVAPDKLVDFEDPTNLMSNF